MTILDDILTNERTPEWMRVAAEAAKKRGPLKAANEAEMLALAIRDWALHTMSKEGTNGNK